MINDAYVVKGEFITCTNGHKIAEVKENIFCDERFQSRHFDFKFGTEEPEDGTPEDKCICKECGGRWFRSALKGRSELHTEGGWT